MFLFTFFFFLLSSSSPGSWAYKSAIPNRQSSHLQTSLVTEFTEPMELVESALSVLNSGLPGCPIVTCSILATRSVSIRDLGRGEGLCGIGRGLPGGGVAERQCDVILPLRLFFGWRYLFVAFIVQIQRITF